MRRIVLAAAFAALASLTLVPARAAERSPEAVVREFYDAFCRHDPATLERLYAPDVKWRDTIFSFDDRAGTMGMWRIELGSDAKFRYRVLSVDGDTVKVNWLADYHLFGRPIHNDVTATLVVKDGLIVSHVDDYDWARWAKQAFPLGSASSWPGVKQVLMGALNVGMRAQIFLNGLMPPKAPAATPPPSKTVGLTGALGR